MTGNSTVGNPLESLELADWHKSSHSNANGGCVEHACLPDGRQAVRDTKDRGRGVLLFSAADWQALVDAARADTTVV